MAKGYLSLILHAHLPFVRHPEYDDFLEEDWLYEAITETYIPLIKVLEGLIRDTIPYRITMSLTPTLISMLEDPLLQSRYINHIEKLIELAEKEMIRNHQHPQFLKLATMYHKRFTEAQALFITKYKKKGENGRNEPDAYGDGRFCCFWTFLKGRLVTGFDINAKTPLIKAEFFV